MAHLEGTVALVTGASSGIGAALAEEFARRGADVVATARRRERLEAVAVGVRDLGRRAVAEPGDVTRDGDLERVVERGLGELGRLDWVVANAGFGVAGSFDRLALDDFRRQIETNVFGVLRTVYATREALIASRGGLGIIGSVSGYLFMPGGAPYAMSKAAVHALAHSLRLELAPRGVGVTLVVPGFVDSEIRRVDNRGRLRTDVSDPVPEWLRMSTPDAARKIVRAVVGRRRERVLTAHGRVAVFLARHAPWLLSALIGRFGGRRPQSRR
jgi:NAD(P)-dependent dehydrogenase (short-subunit alcohol dehydrogenase family)